MTKKTKHHDNPDPVFDDTGPSSSQTPYLVPAHAGVQIESLLSVGDQVGVKEAPAELAGQPWRMVGIPDGLGAFDNGDGTMTVLMNHELGQTLGAVREHGSTGAFVSELIIDTTTHEVLDTKGLSEDVFLFNRTTNAYEETTTQFGRLCSADLPAVSAFYDAATGLGTTERIFMNGEEIGNEGRAFAQHPVALRVRSDIQERDIQAVETDLGGIRIHQDELRGRRFLRVARTRPDVLGKLSGECV